MATSGSRLICSICLNSFKQPLMLDCHHSFCLKCLESFVNKSLSDDIFPCPLCRREIKVPDGGVSKFPSNFYIDSDLEDEGQGHTTHRTSEGLSVDPLRPGQAHSEDLVCELCLGSSAYFRCKECKLFLCRECKANHVSPDSGIFFNHSLEEISDQQNEVESHTELCNRMVKNRCQLKPCTSDGIGEVVYYCQNCLVPMCSDCFVAFHNGHKFLDLRDDVTHNEVKGQLTRLKFVSDSHVRNLKRHLTLLNQKLRVLVESSVSSCCDVDNHVTEICAKVKVNGQKVKNEINHQSEKEQLKLSNAIKTLELELENFDFSLDQSNSVLESSSSTLDFVKRIEVTQIENNKIEEKQPKIPLLVVPLFVKREIDVAILSDMIGKREHDLEYTFISSFIASDVRSKQVLFAKEFRVLDRLWYVGVRKNSEDILGVYLNLKTIPEVTSSNDLATHVTCKLVNHDDDNQSVVNQLHHKFTPGGVSWGWNSFTDWDNVVNPRLCFREDAIFIIETTIRQVEEVYVYLDVSTRNQIMV